MSAKKLTLSAQAGFVCPFQYSWGFSSLVAGFFDNLIVLIVELFLCSLSCPSVPCVDRGSDSFGVTALLFPGKSAPCLLFFSSHNGEGLDRLSPFYKGKQISVFLYVI